MNITARKLWIARLSCTMPEAVWLASELNKMRKAQGHPESHWTYGMSVTLLTDASRTVTLCAAHALAIKSWLQNQTGPETPTQTAFRAALFESLPPFPELQSFLQ